MNGVSTSLDTDEGRICEVENKSKEATHSRKKKGVLGKKCWDALMLYA